MPPGGPYSPVDTDNGTWKNTNYYVVTLTAEQRGSLIDTSGLESSR